MDKNLNSRDYALTILLRAESEIQNLLQQLGPAAGAVVRGTLKRIDLEEDAEGLACAIALLELQDPWKYLEMSKEGGTE